MRHCRILVSICVFTLATAVRGEVPLRWDSTGHVVVPALVNGTGPGVRETARATRTIGLVLVARLRHMDF
jgi:hypothetical protein